MSKSPRWAWRQVIQRIAMPISMIVGVIFKILGKNPFFWNSPPDVPLLYISIAIFIITIVLSYTCWPSLRIEATRQDQPRDKEHPALWYENGNMIRANWLVYKVLLPGLCTSMILSNLAAISYLDIFTWLAGAILLVAIIADIVGLVLFIKGFRQRARA